MSKCFASEEKTCRNTQRVYLRAGHADKDARIAAFKDIAQIEKAQVTTYKFGNNRYGFDRWNVGSEHLTSLSTFIRTYVKIQDEDCL